MKRRSFLALLGLAPVGVPAVAEASPASIDNTMREIMAEKASAMMYDIDTDEVRPITQDELNAMRVHMEEMGKTLHALGLYKHG